MGRQNLVNAIAWCALLGTLIPLHAADVFFEESFDASSNSPNLEGDEQYELSTKGGIHRVASTSTSDRRYVRTIISDYFSRDFRYEVTFNIAVDEIVYIGIGRGQPDSAYNEPGASLNFRIHSPELVGGKVEILEQIIGHLVKYGPHRVRITKVGARVVFEVDAEFKGEFHADFSFVVDNLGATAPWILSESSHLFFGCSELGTTFDDVSIQPAEGSAPCVFPGPNLVGWWPGEGDASDLVGGSDSSIVGATFLPAKVGAGFVLDDSSYVEIPDAAALRLSSDSPSTLDSWVYPSALPPETHVPLTAMKPYYYGILYSTSGRYLRAHVNDGKHWIFFDGSFNLPLNAWTHVAQTWDGSSLKVYANGRLIGSGRTEGISYDRIETSAFIGRWLRSEVEPQDFRFTGIIDEVGIYDAALEASEIEALFLAGTKGRCHPTAPPFSIVIAQGGRRCVNLVVTNDTPIKGGELGIAYDQNLVTVSAVKPGADFPSGGDLHFRLNAQNNCPAEQGIRAGLTVAWLNPVTGQTHTPPGNHEMLKICFDLARDQEFGTCSPITFVKCLGVPEAPVKNIVTGLNGASLSLSTKDGRVCIQEELSFIRGDVNADGNFDISDPIAIIGCHFLGDPCPRCPDATDTNDDGLIDLTDPIYLLGWRFIDGPPPPAPFPTCSRDPQMDTLDDCESFLLCQ